MTLFSGDGLVVSLPGGELHRMRLTGSIMTPEAVLANPISAPLRAALDLLCSHARQAGLAVTCIARPELFTNAMAEAWLRKHISPNAQHVCLSDGTAVKHLPGVPTHVFFYCRSYCDNLLSLWTLSRRAPELMAAVRSQINSRFVLGGGANRVQPESVLLTRTTPSHHPPLRLLPFFLNRDSVEDSVNRIERAGSVSAETLADFTEMRYVPLSETALSDRAFVREAAALMLHAYFNPTTLLLLRLPEGRAETPSLSAGMATLLSALRRSDVVLPRVRPDNILFVTEDPTESEPVFRRYPWSMLLHESFEFWRYTTGFYAEAQQITVFSCSDSVRGEGRFLDDVVSIYGTKVIRRRVENEGLSD